MGNDIRSLTAEATAGMRAKHYLHDARPLIFEDPFALSFLNPELAVSVRETGFQQTSEFRNAAVILCRCRYAEDCFQLALGNNVRQYVSLGAGFDTFAQRRTDLANSVQVYEIDLPATQNWKREILESLECGIPGNLELIPANLERETVIEALQRSTFCRSKPAFFSWLGNTMYLTKEAIFRTLETFAKELAPGSEIVFDYRVPIEFVDPDDVEMVQASWKGTAAMGEPQFAWLNPLTLPDEVRALGLGVVERLTPNQMAERYLADRDDALKPMTHHHYIYLKIC